MIKKDQLFIGAKSSNIAKESLHYISKMPRRPLGHSPAKLILNRKQICGCNWSLFFEVESQLGRNNRKLEIWKLRLEEYDFEIILRAGVKHQAAHTLSKLNSEGKDDSYMRGDISVVAVITIIVSVQKVLVGTTPEKTPDGTKEPKLLTLDKLLSTQSADAYCDRIQPSVEIHGL